MNLAKAKLLLDKINRLYKSMSLDEDNVAAIEKDLMRDYVKQLYELFLAEDAPIRNQPNRSNDINNWANKKEIVAPVPVRKKVVVNPPPPPPPVIQEIPIQKAPPPKIIETPPPPPPVIEEIPVRVAVVPAQPKSVQPSFVVDPEHADLFHINLDAKEISEKLGQSRIADLNNAMGLNERIFTVNELFGADNSLYRNIIRDLNQLSSFEEAKAYLSANVAEKFNWTHKSKRNKAKIFIKLVRRRYL